MPACTNERTHFMNINETLNSLKMYGQLIFPSLYFVVSTISINVGLEFSYVMRTKCLETFNYNLGDSILVVRVRVWDSSVRSVMVILITLF